MGGESAFGGWGLGEQIGAGANSRVYRAEGSDQTAVVKVSTVKKKTSERYLRFLREIESLRALADDPGVMPLIDSAVPAASGGEGYPWYAMPEGVPLDRALGEADLEEVVVALADLAASLSRLHQRGYQHRDVKPQNLFLLPPGSYVLGDLGLIAVPEELRGSLTITGSLVGPANFSAPEMLNIDPTSVDARLSDVYSLAKVLWALGAGERYPLPGHQRAGDRRSLAAISGDGRAEGLDELIERATEHEPERRPSMNEVASVLERWLPTSTAEEDDLADLEEAIREARVELSGAHSVEEDRRRRSAEGDDAFAALVAELAPVFAAVARIGTDFIVDSPESPDATLQFPNVETMGGPQVEWARRRFDQSLIGDQIDGVRLDVATSATLFDDGILQLVVGVAVNELPMTLGGPPFQWAASREPQLATIAVRGAIQELGREARSAMTEAVGVFAQLGSGLSERG